MIRHLCVAAPSGGFLFGEPLIGLTIFGRRNFVANLHTGIIMNFLAAIIQFILPRWAIRAIPSLERKLGIGTTEVEDFPSQPPERGFALQKGARFLTAIGPIVLGGWISVGGGEIVTATEHFLSIGSWHRPVRWGTVFFWVVALAWTRALYLRLDQEDQFESRRRANLVRALYHLPNLAVLWNYHSYFREIINIYSEFKEGNIQSPEKGIEVMLAVLAEMARTFSKSDNESYGANVMLALNKEDVSRAPKKMKESVKFVEDTCDVEGLDGLLVLPEDLAVMDIDSEDVTESRNYPLISLPIRTGPSELILPGASTAILEGGLMSVYQDTRNLADECTGFSEPVRQSVREYFSPVGQGSDVRSFASIRLGDGNNPVGVLNIDTDGENVIGAEEEYYATFKSLVRPLLDLMIPLVEAYARDYRQRKLA